MSIISDEMKDVLNGSLWVFSTATKGAEPNAVPIHYKKILGDNQLLLVDNFMKKSKENLLSNPRVAVTSWKDKTGFQLKGNARYETAGPFFEEGCKMIPEGSGMAPKGVVIVDVEAIYSISPGPQAGSKLD